MKRSLVFGLCASLPMLFGSTSFTVNNADLVYVSGPGPVEVTNGTEIYRNASEAGSPWSALFTRNAGQQQITLAAGTGGAYQLQVWSIPSDPMNPQRQHSTSTVLIDDDGQGPYGVSDLLTQLATWGQCPSQGECAYDLNNDGMIDVADLLILLANWVEND